MTLTPIEQNEDENTITEQREELMIPPNCEGKPTLRKAHFLKPLLNPKITPLPKPPFHNSLSSNPNIKQLKKVISLKSVIRPQSSWKSWVDNLQKTHENIWKKVGIFNAIKGSTYKVTRSKDLIFCLAEKWNPKTNTFVFSWGECSVTLEDIMILGGFSIMGNSVISPCCGSKKFAEIKDELMKCVPVIRKNWNNVLNVNGWLEYFKGKGGELEHVAFLVFWLSRYVLMSTYSCIVVGKYNVFDIAISLAFGTKVALAPAVLASIYRDLTTLKQEIVNHVEGSIAADSEIMVWGPLHLVQFWAWERFPGLSPKPASLPPHGQLRMARWHNVRKLKSENLRLEIESAGDSFVWRPYVLSLKNWDIPKFYCDEGMWVVINSELDEELLSFVRCLRPCELVGLDCVMQYSPHRVGMQFGMDQDIPDLVPSSDEECTLAWCSYEKPMDGLKVYLPPRLFEGDVTVQYYEWWKSRVGVYDDDNDVLMTYVRSKGSSQKRKSLSMSIEGDVAGRCKTKDLICSSFEGMIPEKPLKVAHTVASSNALLNQQEDTASKERMENIVAVKNEGKKVDETASNAALNDQEGGIAEDLKGTHAQDIKLSTTAIVKRVNANELGLETEKLCSAVAEDHTQLGKEAMEAIEMKPVIDSPVDVEEQNDLVKPIQQNNLLLESRISRLEKLISMYKQAGFGRSFDV